MDCKETYLKVAQAIRTNGLGNVIAYLLSVQSDDKASDDKKSEAKKAYDCIGITIDEVVNSSSREVMTMTMETLKKVRFAELTSQQYGQSKLFKP